MYFDVDCAGDTAFVRAEIVWNWPNCTVTELPRVGEFPVLRVSATSAGDMDLHQIMALIYAWYVNDVDEKGMPNDLEYCKSQIHKIE